MLDPKDKIVYLECECSIPEHVVRVTVLNWDELPPDFIIDVQARNWRSFLNRCWIALKYIFGAELMWDDVLLSRESVNKLQEAINHYNKLLDNNKKVD
jgi:hypothetical protein